MWKLSVLKISGIMMMWMPTGTWKMAVKLALGKAGPIGKSAKQI
jgi:hypothetical protein